MFSCLVALEVELSRLTGLLTEAIRCANNRLSLFHVHKILIFNIFNKTEYNYILYTPIVSISI